jgi:hypothetical protein
LKGLAKLGHDIGVGSKLYGTGPQGSRAERRHATEARKARLMEENDFDPTRDACLGNSARKYFLQKIKADKLAETIQDLDQWIRGGNEGTRTAFLRELDKIRVSL